MSQKVYNISGYVFSLILASVLCVDMAAGCPVLNHLPHEGQGSCSLVETGSGAILSVGLQRKDRALSRPQEGWETRQVPGPDGL